MYIEFEKVVEFVFERVDSTCNRRRFAVVEGQGGTGFVADGKWDVLQPSTCVRDMFACVNCSIQTCHWHTRPLSEALPQWFAGKRLLISSLNCRSEAGPEDDEGMCRDRNVTDRGLHVLAPAVKCEEMYEALQFRVAWAGMD